MNSSERHERRYQRRKEKRNKKDLIKKYNDFSLITDANVLIDAFYKSKREVGWKTSIQRYEMNLLKNIAEAKNKLEKGESITQGFVEFNLNERGKIRHIKSVYIKERVIQRALCDQVLVPLLSRELIYDNGASMQGKGIHFALNRLTTHLQKYYRHNHFSNDGYVLLIDFSKYFDNISHEKLYQLLEKRFYGKTLNLIKELIEPFGNKKSLGIGSQISQILAIYYPTEIDNYIKQQLHIKYYGRYMDDSYLIHYDKEYLKECLKKLRKKYKEYGIIVNEKKTQIVKISSGFTFLKVRYILTDTGKVIQKTCCSSITRMRRKLKKFSQLYVEEKIKPEDIKASYQSWRGFVSHYDSYHTLLRMDQLYNELFGTKGGNSSE